LVGAKLLNISVPFLAKYSVDFLVEASNNAINVDSPEVGKAKPES
jgi:hypothetical protein